MLSVDRLIDTLEDQSKPALCVASWRWVQYSLHTVIQAFTPIVKSKTPKLHTSPLLAIQDNSSHGLFRSTLRPAVGASTFVLAVTFLPAALTATFFLAAVAGGAFPPFLTTVVPVEVLEVLEVLLLLLTDRVAGVSCITGAPRLDRVTAIFGAAGGFVALRAGAAFPRTSFGFSGTKNIGGAAAPVSLVGEATFRDEDGLSGENGRARKDF